VHVHACLGRLPAFHKYYTQNRRLQLASDLSPPADILGGYQAFVARLAGFFLLEDHVARCADVLPPGAQVPRRAGPARAGAPFGAAARACLRAPRRPRRCTARPRRWPGAPGGYARHAQTGPWRGARQADSGWELAAACLKTVLGNACEVVASARDMLAVKDFTLLVCSALGALPCAGRRRGARGGASAPRPPARRRCGAHQARTGAPAPRRRLRLSRGAAPGDAGRRARQVPRPALQRRGGAGAARARRALAAAPRRPPPAAHWPAAGPVR